jgi:HSP20 family protein
MGNVSFTHPATGFGRLNPFGDGLMAGFALWPVIRRLEETDPQIRLHVSEDDTAFTVTAEIPGLGKDDVNVSIDGSLVFIKAQAESRTDEKAPAGVIRLERCRGTLYRMFKLEQEVDREHAAARYDDGVLVLTLPKKPGSGAKQLTIA